MVDGNQKADDNKSVLPDLEKDGVGESLKIPKKDLVWIRTNTHEHQYKPDFTDEWEGSIALVCTVEGCIVGKMVRKDGKKFLKWLDEHRATPRGKSLV